jgi:hypothetical protein
MPWRHNGGAEVQLHSFLTLTLKKSGQLHALATLPPGKNPCTLCPTTCLDISEKRKITRIYWGRKPVSCSLQHSHYSSLCHTQTSKITSQSGSINLLEPSGPVQTCNNGTAFPFSSPLHVSDDLSVHHQESKTVHTPSGICQTDSAECLLAGTRRNCSSISFPLASTRQNLSCHIPDGVCTVLDSWWWTERPSETCKVLPKNKINLRNWCILLVLQDYLQFPLSSIGSTSSAYFTENQNGQQCGELIWLGSLTHVMKDCICIPHPILCGW